MGKKARILLAVKFVEPSIGKFAILPITLAENQIIVEDVSFVLTFAAVPHTVHSLASRPIRAAMTVKRTVTELSFEDTDCRE